MQINDIQRRSYFEHGYLIFEPELPAGLIDEMRDQVDDRYPARAPDGSFPKPTRIQDAWTFSPAVHAAATHPCVLEMLESLYGRTPLPFQTINFPVGTEQHAHADTIHFNSLPAGWMCGVWLALEDIHPDCGPLVYYPGSHTLPEGVLADPPRVLVNAPVATLKRGWHRLMVTLRRRTDSRDYGRYEMDVQATLRHYRLEPKFATLRKGQALIWSANLLHGGSARRDPNRTRHSLVTHYFFEGCRYFRPVLSGRRAVHWFRPNFVPRSFGYSTAE
jgi:ectoine hydroxylase-related dioxygenase (phytanoyl-CoA dioxygenase family)